MGLPKLCLIAVLCGAGCKSASAPTGYGVNLTVSADDLSDGTRAAITHMQVRASGAESYSTELTTGDAFVTGDVRVHYTPSVTDGTLSFKADAFDDTNTVVGYGDGGPIALVAGEAIGLDIVLRPGSRSMVTPTDGGPGDGSVDGATPHDLSLGPCANGVKDGTESDVDCGGGTCAPCDPGKACMAQADCSTGLCVAGHCDVFTGPPSWVSVANMPTARQHFAMTLAADGKIYALGGNTTGATAIKNVEIYDPATNTWDTSTAAAGLPTARAFCDAALDANGKIVLVAGKDAAGTVLSSVDSFTPPSTGATGLPAYPETNWLVEAVKQGSLVYAGGGSTGGTGFYAWNGSAWSTKAVMAHARSSFGLAAGIDGKVYAMGGYQANTAEVYTPTSNTWAPCANLPDQIGGTKAIGGPDGRIYVVGGYTPLVPFDSRVWAYSPTADRWAAVAPLSVGRYEAAVALGPDGRLYAAGGHVSDGPTVLSQRMEYYGPAVTVTGPSKIVRVGDTMSVSGSNFASAAPVRVYDRAAPTVDLATGTTNVAGVLSTITFSLPVLSLGAHTIVIVDGKSRYPVQQSIVVGP